MSINDEKYLKFNKFSINKEETCGINLIQKYGLSSYLKQYKNKNYKKTYSNIIKDFIFINDQENNLGKANDIDFKVSEIPLKYKDRSVEIPNKLDTFKEYLKIDRVNTGSYTAQQIPIIKKNLEEISKIDPNKVERDISARSKKGFILEIIRRMSEKSWVKIKNPFNFVLLSNILEINT